MTTPPPAAPPTSSFIRPAVGLLAGLGVSLLIIWIGTVIAGLMTLRGPDALTSAYPVSYVWGKLAAAALGALAGGFATSRITVGRSLYTVFLLALILFIAAAGPAWKHKPLTPGDPDWYPLSQAFVVVVGVVLGGLFERWREAVAERSR
jgi:hypothetical protein